ncbi:UNVERIFIED_CONTAM: Cilia- and flagella-associated protein 44, partial [Siphonaria sp. JEL0065]
MNLYRILRGGTTRAYSDISFNAKGDKLASVGSDPDYMLTVWNWRAQEITLKSKAFSQDVYKVAFAPENDGILTTSGMGHIKFWQMSATFTGLKLQGYLGKFGASELTDICSFIQLPDGKVLSSTETGNLLLWDGGMIKCEIAQKGKKPCHIGKIEVVLMVDSEVFTAGEDGYVRVWDFEMIDNADVTSETAGPGAAPVSSSGPAVARVFEMEFLEEFMIGKDVKIKNMIRSIENPSQYLILDMEGHLFKLDTKQRFIDKTLSFHSGGIAGLNMSPTCHSMVSLGYDGVVHLYDYLKKALLAKEKYTAGGTALTSLPLCLDARGCTVAAGFSDGVLRIISFQPPPLDVNRPVFTLQYAFKPHKCPIAGVAISSDGTYMATYGTSDRTIFFFKIENKPSSPSDDNGGAPFDKGNVTIVPIGFVEMEEPVSHISFSADNHTQNIEPNEEGEEDDSDEEEDDGNGPLDGKLAFIVCTNGEIFSSRVPHPRRVNTSLTFQLDALTLRIEKWKLNVPAPKIVEAPKPKEVEEEKKEAPGSASGAKKEDAPPTAPEPAKEDPKADKRIGSAIRKARGLCITDTSAISRILYLPGGYFLMALVNKYGEGEIRSCKFDAPDKSRLLLVGKNKFTDIKLSSTGKYLIAGTADGMTCIRQIKLDDMLLHKWEQGHETYEHYSKCFDDVAHAIKMQRGVPQGGTLPKDKIYDGQYWMGHVHDCDRGAITNVSLSFDEAFLCSSGTDGGIFMFRFNPKEINEREAPNFDFYDMEEQEATPDIIDKNVYTIQETKIKSERDRELSEAEQKKQATRDYISELRSEYLKLLGTMESQKTPRSHISVDPDLQMDIENETLQRIANVKKELEWISEKESIGPNKLKRKFLDPIQTSHIRVTALKTAGSVSTFRTLMLPEKSDFGIHTLINNERAVSRGHPDAKGGSGGDGAATGGDQ